MRNALLLTILLFIAITTQAQRRRDDTSHYRSQPIPAHLLPIERALGSSALGSVYYYGGKKLSSPFSLEVPFYEIDDPAVSRHFRNFRTWTTLSRLTSLATLAYVLVNNNGRKGAYWTVYGGSIAAALTFTIIGNGQVNKAVTRYNQLLRQPRVGLSTAPMPNGQVAVGVGVAYGF
ncbi:hypothetical protein DYU11_15815 [Fibrisoma montanum]|uniref:DUF5683 domain-containing protein n=1 Tax=Fibrisoma montanum TaxID=2305895 RepID=A0A418M8R1_9BACT|nr:hypothetical protein [Fibrisoma montanum]RIV22482.1 hypothetical protein DYU11_15815 [Fibrisoma montanum]